MYILFTGASSFTGYWFVKELIQSGHHVVAVFRQSHEFYTGLRRKRIDQLIPNCQTIFNCEFGSNAFSDLIKNLEKCDLFCHHAADVTNYKSPNFDIPAALMNNTKNVRFNLEQLLKKHCQTVLLTGSLFEQHEGAGSEGLRAFSPYGLSKSFTAEVFKFHAEQLKMNFRKFIIPNPFGPYEEPRFTAYLMQNWMNNKIPIVNTPAYVRDNIPISLLAKAYAYYVNSGMGKIEKFNPSGYIETQATFTERVATEMRKRLILPCQFELAVQKEFLEPLVRVNTDSLKHLSLHWNEEQAWDDFAEFYGK